MAAGEDQAQAVILDRLRLWLLGDQFRFQPLRHLLIGNIKARLAPQLVNHLKTPGGNQPGARVLRNPLTRPLVERRGKGLLQRLFREIKVTEQANQCCKGPAGFLAINGLQTGSGQSG